MHHKLLPHVVVLVLAFALSASADIVFENTSTRLSFGGVDQGYSSTNEFGDQIVLADTAREVDQFSFQYFLKVNSGVSTGLEVARIRFYANDGGMVSGANSPGTMLWDSGDFSIPVSDGFVKTLPVPNIVVPDTFTWTILFGNVLPTETTGLPLYNPPTVGSDFSDFWELNGSSWELRFNRNFPVNFDASVDAIGMAVPEPSTVAMIAISGLAWLGCARSRSRR
jgi:hypothetical protein